MTIQQRTALRAIARAIVESVREAGSTGAPGGILYAALMASGCRLSQFQSLMSVLVTGGYLSRSGECYYFVKAI